MNQTSIFGIDKVAYFLPDTIRNINDWVDKHNISNERLQALEESGVYSFHDSGNLSLLEMSESAMRKLLHESDIDPDEVDLIVFANSRHTSCMSLPGSIAETLRKKFKMENALTFSLGQQNCASIVTAMKVIETMMLADHSLCKAIIVSADLVPSELDHLRLLDNSAIHSDGATAMLLSRDSEKNRILALSNMTDGKYYLGTLNPLEDSSNYALATTMMIRSALRKANTRSDAVTAVLPNHVNLPIWHLILESLQIQKNKLFESNFKRLGHVFGNDWIINLADRLKTESGITVAYTYGLCACYGVVILES